MAIFSAWAVWLVGCAAPAALDRPQAPAVLTGTVKSVKGQPLDGLILLERGELHGNVWDAGTLVRGGTFRLELPRGGQYGLHLYSSGYFYRPQAIAVESGKTLSLDLLLAPEPTRARDPVIKRAGFFPWEARQGRVSFAKIEVADPDDNLGPQVMAFNARTGRAYAMAPPTSVGDLKANFPQGVYQLEIVTETGPLDPRDWFFVVADHACFTSDILAYPHEPAPAQVVQ
jgi:hypothetical protein